MTPEESARAIFGERAALYTTSRAHTDPQVLARVVELARPEKGWSALDVATGTGHTAFALAPHLKRVIATDITPEMLAEGEKLRKERAIENVEFAIADVHALPYDDGSFELVTCRRAAHHFSDIGRALEEMKRVLVAGGRLVIDDRSVPEDDRVDEIMNQLDTYHDPSHIRQYRASEWITMLEDAGFTVEAVEPYTKHRPIDAFTKGVDAENVRRIVETIEGLDEDLRRRLNLTEESGEVALNHWYLLVAAVKN